MTINRKPKHIELARQILTLDYQDQLAAIGELIANTEICYELDKRINKIENDLDQNDLDKDSYGNWYTGYPSQ